MAAGDTIGGEIRIVLEDTQGNRNVVMGSLPQSKVDYTNQDTSPDERQYINTARTSKVTAPSGAQRRSAPDAYFEAGERMIIQHKSSNDQSRNIDHTADAFDIEGVFVDKNRNNSYSGSLSQSDQELTGTTSENDEGFEDIYQYTVPDRTRFNVAGAFEAVAIEA